MPITLDSKTIVRRWNEDVKDLEQRILTMKDHKHKNDGIYDQMLEVGMVALALNNDRLERALLGTLKVNTKNNEEGNMWIC